MSSLRNKRRRARKRQDARKKNYGGDGWRDGSGQLIFRGKKLRQVSDAMLLAMYQDTVYGCASLNAKNVAMAKLRVYALGGTDRFKTKKPGVKQFQRFNDFDNPFEPHGKALQGEEVVELVDHPLNKLLKFFNITYPAVTGYELTQLYLDLVGKCFWYLLKHPLLKVPVEIIPLPAQYTKVVLDRRGFISHYEFRYLSHNIRYEIDDIVYFRYANPSKPWDGYAPLEAALGEAFLMESEQTFEQALYDNGARPDLIIQSKTKLSKDQTKRLEAKWMAAHRGAIRAGVPAILENEMSVQEIGMTPKEAQSLVRVKFSREQVCNMFDVPITRFQISKNRAESEAANYAYQKEGIMPRLNLLEDTMNKYLVPLYDDTGRLFVAYDSTVPQDKEFRQKEKESNLKTGYSSINQERAKDGKEPVPWGATPWLPLNLAPVTVPREEEPEKPKTKDAEHVGCTCNKDAGNVFAMTRKERTLAKNVEKVFKNTVNGILRKLRALEPKKTVNKIEAGQVFAVEPMQDQFLEIAEIDLGGFVEAGGTEGVEALRAQGFEIEDFLITNPAVEEFIDDYKFKFSRKVPESFQEDLQKILRENVQTGESIPQLRKQIEAKLGGTEARKRAQMIARTESKRAKVRGQIASWRQSDVVVEIQWMNFTDACPWCQEMSGKTVSVNQVFHEQGEAFTVADVTPDGAPVVDEGGDPREVTMNLDYEDVVGPPLHPNCRCELQAITTEV